MYLSAKRLKSLEGIKVAFCFHDFIHIFELQSERRFFFVFSFQVEQPIHRQRQWRNVADCHSIKTTKSRRYFCCIFFLHSRCLLQSQWMDFKWSSLCSDSLITPAIERVVWCMASKRHTRFGMLLKEGERWRRKKYVWEEKWTTNPRKTGGVESRVEKECCWLWVWKVKIEDWRRRSSHLTCVHGRWVIGNVWDFLSWDYEKKRREMKLLQCIACFTCEDASKWLWLFGNCCPFAPSTFSMISFYLCFICDNSLTINFCVFHFRHCR